MTPARWSFIVAATLTCPLSSTSLTYLSVIIPFIIHFIQPSLSYTSSPLNHTLRPITTTRNNCQDGVGGDHDCVCIHLSHLLPFTVLTLFSVDNSESSRNGDYVPSRWEAQTDAANLIFQYKTQANPESSVGLMSMGGGGPEVLTTLTTNPGKVLDGLHRTKIRGQSHFHTAIMIAAVRYIHLYRQTHAVILTSHSSPSNTDRTNLNGRESSYSPAPLSTAPTSHNPHWSSSPSA